MIMTQTADNNDKFVMIEDMLTDYLQLLEQRLRYDDRHGDLSLRQRTMGDNRSVSVFPNLRTAQIEYHVRDVQNMIGWLKDPV
jgi:hypothetical protein